ncbi:MAG TPA: hypothetical protein DEQ34_12040 [Balneolaceae bacterium]|nr:hypothetical protein [Balneolaceae bacterium]|tara:strand:- start:1118 stop:2626 length:1509 start_codon:yes stop_codon:yes gene_type:complete
MLKAPLILVVLISCTSALFGQNTQTYSFTIKPEKTHQIIHNFGASDAWSIQYFGKNWPAEKRNQAADYLFSTEVDEDGNPLGIGLTLWRFNIGGGTAELGEKSEIPLLWRRAESFIDENGNYDWSKQAGQQWFMNAAMERGVDQFVAFSNTPPVHFTLNGKGFSEPGDHANLKPDAYDDFAEFLATVALHFDSLGMPFDYISPVNEPQWNWDNNKQEGSSWRNEQIYKLVNHLNEALVANGSDTKIEIPEAARQIDLYSAGGIKNRDRQLYRFFDPASEYYIGDLKHVALKVAAHSYFTTYPPENLIEVRDSLRIHIDQLNPDIEFWMSEYCLLEDNEEVKGPGRDLGIDPALYLAKVIHHDLVYAQSNSWQWWLGVSPFNYKDGLVYITDNITDGDVYDSKMLWALGNYSRFVRPGMHMIEVEGEAPGIYLSAFKGNGEIIVVAINENKVEQKIGLKGISGSVKKYVTAAGDQFDLKYVGEFERSDSVNLTSRSVTTFVIK